MLWQSNHTYVRNVADVERNTLIGRKRTKVIILLNLGQISDSVIIFGCCFFLVKLSNL